jgi:hypothetical protein
MTGPFADRLFRIAFVLAGCYNLAFGLWAAIWPLSFFRLFDIPLPRYPGIWACLGMVVGVYGLLYWHAAWRLSTAWPIIAVGLLGKVLGPIGMAVSFSDDWPRRLGMLCVYNDLIWWLPFGLFLVRGTRFARWLTAAAPWLCVVIHVAALAATGLLLKQGTSLEPNAVVRTSFVASYETEWTIGWAIWMLAAASWVGFCAWWAGKLNNEGTSDAAKISRGTIVASSAVVIAAVGTIFDFSGEGSLILLAVERAREFVNGLPPALVSFEKVERAFMLLSAAAANGLYTVAGILLTLITPGLPKGVRVLMWISWIAGITMTVAGIIGHTALFIVSSIGLFPPFLVWIAWMGAYWRPAVQGERSGT